MSGSVVEVGDIRDWQGLGVVDQEGSKIGTLEGVYFDTASDQPAFASVKRGVPAKLVFVPLAGSKVSPKRVQVPVDKKTAKDAPSIETTGELTSEQEPDLYAHYGLPYERGAGGERRLGRR